MRAHPAYPFPCVLLSQANVSSLPSLPPFARAGNTQWFYFRVTGAGAGATVRFNLVNHTKEDSLFNYGLLPAVYSDADAGSSGVGWRCVLVSV